LTPISTVINFTAEDAENAEKRKHSAILLYVSLCSL
jgi:hypothetical protein